MKPINGWIVVETLKKPDRTPGGIILPEPKEKEKIQRNRVVSISQDVLNACEAEGRELPYKVGDIIITHSQVGIEMVPFKKDDNTMLMKFDAPMAVITQEEYENGL